MRERRKRANAQIRHVTSYDTKSGHSQPLSSQLLILLVGACGFEPQTLRIREYIYQASSELLQVESLLFLHK